VTREGEREERGAGKRGKGKGEEGWYGEKGSLQLVEVRPTPKKG